MKGADQCPRCASPRWRDIHQRIMPFYEAQIRVCGNCGTAWEPFSIADLSDPKAPLDGFTEPCSNCAFRPASHEQQDVDEWQKIIGSLKSEHHFAAFYCHKGVPITPGQGHGFAYPVGADGKPITRKLRLCRGYLNMLRARQDKAKKAAATGIIDDLAAEIVEAST